MSSRYLTSLRATRATASLLLLGLLLAATACGNGGGNIHITHQEWAYYLGSPLTGLETSGLSESAQTEINASLNGVSYYMADYGSRRFEDGEIHVGAFWNYDPDPEIGYSYVPPDARLERSGDTVTLQFLTGPVTLTGAFSAAAAQTALDEAFANLAPATFEGARPGTTLLKGLSTQPLQVTWSGSLLSAGVLVPVSFTQALTAEVGDYTLVEDYSNVTLTPGGDFADRSQAPSL